MFPPQLGSSLGSSLRHHSATSTLPLSLRLCHGSIVRSTTAYGQSRNFWSGRRTAEYTSHLDPMFHRFTRYRTLKTRAKLLNKLRRREQWDLPGAKPFFTSRHIRQASHWNGGARGRWIRYNENDEAKSNEKETTPEEDGYELNKREREWKEQMEKMRKRIERDPYEAVFGKRFEPFWSPLVPSWMREEMGLQGWPKNKDTYGAKAPSGTAAMKANNPERKTPASSIAQTPESSLSDQPTKSSTDAEANDGPPNGQLTNYSYTSSTSWDSITQKAQREEWDSISGQVRKFEYDPISNRMVQITMPPITNTAEPKTTPTSSTATAPSSKVASSNPPAVHVQASKDVGPVSIPVKTIDDARKAIHVPTHAVNSAPKTSIYFPSLLNPSTAPGPSVSTLPSDKPAERDLDSLTADDIRASMGKPKAERDVNNLSKVNSTRSEWDRAETRFMLDRELDALMQTKATLLRDEHGMFHIGKQKKDLQKLDGRIAQVKKELEDIDTVQPSRSPLNNFDELKHRLSTRSKSVPSAATPTTTTVKPVRRADPPQRLQSFLERMRSGQPEETEEPDDSAAHESTGDRIVNHVSNIPKGWDTQVETLQADRVQRASETAAKPKLQVPRWIDEMNARRAQFEARKAQAKVFDVEQDVKKQKADSILNAEVREQKLRMQAYENRYAHKQSSPAREPDTVETTETPSTLSNEQRYIQKTRDLRKELDIAFKQSSVQAEKHMERIRSLERELEEAQAGNQSNTSAVGAVERERYAQKIRALRKELDVTFKQSSINAEMQVERTRALEKELEDARSTSKAAVDKGKPVEAMRAEGDFCTNITKFAKNSSKWYKKPAYAPTTTTETSKPEAINMTPEESARALVQKVRDIYEDNYGKIDYDHMQPVGAPLVQKSRNSSGQVFAAEIDPELGEALDTFENDRPYRFKDEDLENRVAREERAAYESQALSSPASSEKPSHVIAEGLPLNQASYDPQFAESTTSASKEIKPDLAPKVPTYESSEVAQAKSAEWGITWEEPPVYKVLAYDSGNDLFTSATTSSNFTGKESPMSIQQALSQLYQPARFVPQFSELQKEGFQVVDATNDLLVFKKVKPQPRAEPKTSHPEIATALQDHGLATPSKPSRAKRNNPRTMAYHGINPIDGTSWAVPEKPSTGDFASPTGFVGDRWEAIESQSGKKSNPDAPSSASVASTTSTDAPLRDQDDFPVQLPRVKREERVFTGARLGERTKDKERRRKRHHHEPTAEKVREMRTKWRGYRARGRWVLGAGLGAAGVAYGIGAMAERKERRETERWQQILEGKRTRWE